LKGRKKVGLMEQKWEKCYKSVSDIPVSNSKVPKSCSGYEGRSCSGHGICQYKSLVTNQNTPSCFENDFSCVPVCLCDVGFTSSPSCDVSDEQAAIKMVYRENLLTGIQSLISTEDVSDGSISDWINNLGDATRITGELSSSSVLKAIEIADTITATAQQSGSSSSSLLAILDSLDSICSAHISNNQGNRRRQLADGDSSSFLALQSSVEKYSYFIATSLIPGQEPVTQLKSNIRLYMYAVKPAELPQDSSNCDSSTLVMLPQSTAEKILGVQPNFIVVPTCRRSSVSSDNLQIAVSSLSNEIYQNSYNSDPLSLSLSTFPCSDANCRVKIIMKRDATSSLNASLIEAENRRRFNTSCGLHDYSVHYFDCPNGHRYNVTCRGKEEIVVGRCPRIMEIPSCNSFSGSNVVQNSCEMLSYTKKNFTCLCSLLGLSSSRRSLLLANDSSAVLPDKDIHVNYVAMLEAVTGNFESTVLSAGSLNANMIEKGWQAMVTIGTLIGAIVIAMGWSHYADKQNQRIEISESQSKNKALSLAAKLQPSTSFKMRAPPSIERRDRARKDASNNVLQLAEESLPQILGSKSFVAKMKVELKRHHRWLGVVYHYSNKLSRLLRVISLANNIIIMLFVQSLTYELTNGNDGTCERLTSEQSCLEPQSAYSTGQSKCFWDPSVGEDGKCGYIQPDNNVEVILFVAIFSALITTPFALLADKIIIHVLAAPTLSGKSKVKQLKVTDVKALEDASSIVPRNVLKLKLKESKQKQEQEKKIWISALRKFESLTGELRKYRELLTDPKERKEFEGKKQVLNSLLHFVNLFLLLLSDLWGIDENGNYKEPASSQSFFSKMKMFLVASITETQENTTVGDLILSELENVETAIKTEKELFQKERLSEREKGKRLLFLFQKDLMPGINGMILESKDKRDALVINGSSRTAKMVAWAFLIAVNTGMLFYILLFALSQDSHHQQAWGQSFALWLVVEVFLVSTVTVLLMQVLIPSLTMKDVAIIKKKLIVNVISFYKEMAKKKSQGTEEKEGQIGVEIKSKVFNSAEYLFISNRLAHFYSDLRIAKMILGFQTPWPKQSYQYITDTSKKYERKFSALQRSLSIVVLFFLTSLLSVPISVQDMIIQCASTVTIGYTVLFHLRLYQIFPVLIVVPTIFLGVIIHFMIQSNKSKKKVDDIKLIKEIKTMETEKKNAYQVLALLDDNNLAKKRSTPLEEAISVSQEKQQPKEDDEQRIAGLMKHKKRRESLQQGIKVAQQIETVLQKVQAKKKEQEDEDNNESLHTLSDDFLLSNESSSVTKYQKNVDGLCEEKKSDELLTNDKSAFPTFSPRKAFAYLSQRFTTEVENDDHNDPEDCSLSDDYEDDIDSDEDDFGMNDDNDDDDDLFNLHLAKDGDSDIDDENDDEMSSDDSILDELKTQASMKLVSLSNTSLASMVLLDQSGFERRRKSYEVPSSPIKEIAFSDDDEEDIDDNLSSIHLPPLQQHHRQNRSQISNYVERK
jgi:hypothetical protein